MKIFTLIISCFLGSQSLLSQITIGSNTIPDLGDVLVYNTFSGVEDTLSYRQNGANLNWSYPNSSRPFVFDGDIEESYEDISMTEYADSFPTANMIVDFDGLSAAAIRDENGIEMIGFPDLTFGGFALDGKAVLSNSFPIRSTPFSYGDKIEDEFSFSLTFPSNLLTGLDSIILPIGGATLDSIRFTTTVYKSEEATAWGTLNLDGQNMDVLKIEQRDSTYILLEIALRLFDLVIWVDLSNNESELGISEDGIPSSSNSITYKFLNTTSKTHVLEFTEERVLDSQGLSDTLVVTGSIGNEMMLANEEMAYLDPQLNLYPNPTRDYIILSSVERAPATTTVKIYDLNGRQLINLDNYLLDTKIDIRTLPTGSYILKQKGSTGNSTYSFEVHR